MNSPLDEPAAADIPLQDLHSPPIPVTAPDDSSAEKAAQSDDPHRSPPRDACDTGGFSSAGQRQVLTEDR